MSAVAENIREEQAANFDRWGTLGWHVSVSLIRFDTWEEEVEYVDTFFAHRIELMDSFLK